MIKLRTILLYDFLYYIILGIALIYFLIVNNFVIHKSYYEDKKIDNCIITNIVKKDYGIKLELFNRERILAYYYIDSKEIANFINNYSLGDKVSINYEKLVITNNTLDNTFNNKEYLYNKQIYKNIEIKQILLVKKNKNIFYSIKNYLLNRSFKLKKSYPYISTLLFGNNSYIENDVLDSFRENGISHLFAISGTHLAIFIFILDFVLKKLKVLENKRYFIIIIFLIFYMFLTNFSMSVMRASIFTILLFINKIYYFNIKSSNLLFLTLAIILFINPLNIYDIGLQYSFLISLGLIIIGPYLEKEKQIKKLLTISLISFIISIPITINNFYQLNYLSIIYNILFVPFVSIIVLPLIMIGYLLPFCDNLLYLFISLLEYLSLFLSKINIFKFIYCKPSLSINVLYWLLIIVIIINFKKCKIIYYLPLLLLLIINNIWVYNKEDYLTFIDVGQGDCMLLSVNDTYSLIDTGGIVMLNDSKYTYKLSKNKIIPYLKSRGIKRIDNLILTHGDNDHMLESYYIIDNFKVEKVIFNCGEFNELESELIKVLTEKKIPYYSCIKELNIDNNKLYFLQTQEYDNENDNSNVIYTEIDGYKFMFMGDASITTENEILKKYNINNVDVLKVGHHGSKTSSGENFINEMNPKYSIISVGKNNRYGHPNKEVLNTLDKSKIYRTDQDGSIMFKIQNRKLEIETCSP